MCGLNGIFAYHPAAAAPDQAELIATRDANNSYAFVYLPQNQPVTIDVSRISGNVKKVYWYSPETGNVVTGNEVRSGQRTFTPPKVGKDWVLVIDDASRKYPPPGRQK